MSKIEKINEEIVKAKAKMTEIQGKIRDLERQKKEAEDIEIVAAIRSGRMSERDMFAMIRKFKRNETKPKIEQGEVKHEE